MHDVHIQHSGSITHLSNVSEPGILLVDALGLRPRAVQHEESVRLLQVRGQQQLIQVDSVGTGVEQQCVWVFRGCF